MKQKIAHSILGRVRYPNQLLTLIAFLKKLPGVGSKTAERFAFSLLQWEAQELISFSKKLSTFQTDIYPCATCGCLQDTSHCHFCDPSERACDTLCLVSSPRDVYAIEETGVFKGLYHVLGGLLSPLEGRSIDQSDLTRLMTRLESHPIEEVIIALDSTLEGDATALFIKKSLEASGMKTTRLALGLPMGSSLDFVDYGTLEKAFTGRGTF